MSSPHGAGPPAGANGRTLDADATRSYYGQPVIKEPVWTPEIPWYFFTGGLAGASAGLAQLAELRGCEELARRAWATAGAAVLASPALLISDLGRPARFMNMLRMVKLTSPMSVGSWVLAASGASTSLAAAEALFPLPGALARLRPLARAARPVSAVLGLPLSTYTGALIAQTAVPAWHEARRELPTLFAAGAAASAGAAATALTPPAEAAPARRLALLGVAAELAAMKLIEHRLGEASASYHRDRAGRYARAARGLTAAGALVVAARAAHSRVAAAAGGALILAGAVCERFSVFRAGFQSAADPRHTIGPQRRRVAAGQGHGASRGATPAADSAA